MKLQVNETNVKPVTKKGFTASSFNGKSGVAYRFLDAAEEIESTQGKNSVLTLYLDIDIEDKLTESNMKKIDSQTKKVLKKAEARTVLPYTYRALENKAFVALKNERIQDALMNYNSQGSRNSRTQTLKILSNEKSETLVTLNSLIPDEGVILQPMAAFRPTPRKQLNDESSP